VNLISVTTCYQYCISWFKQKFFLKWATRKLLLYEPTIELSNNKVRSDSTVAGYRQFNRNFLRCRDRKYSLSHCTQTGSGTHSALYSMGIGGSFLEGKQPGHEAYHSPPFGAQFKHEWSYISIPLYPLMLWWLIKHKDNFTCTFTLFYSRHL
jgi:hypothetical protein